MHDGSGTTFADATPNANTITASNITWGTGTGVTSPTFNGTTSFGVAAQIPITDFDGTLPFSISVWINAVGTVESQLVGNLNPVLIFKAGSFLYWEMEASFSLSYFL